MQHNLYHQFDISVQDLQVFLALAESLSFVDAAKALGKSQPTISNRLKLLEDKLQTQLILRTSKFVSLSEDGKQFRDYALRVVEEMSILHNRFHEKGDKRPSVIKVCSTTMIGFAGVRAGVKKLGELNPQLKIEYRVDTAKNCVQLVLDGQADLAVVPNDSLPADVQFSPLLADACQATDDGGEPVDNSGLLSGARENKFGSQEDSEANIAPPADPLDLSGETDQNILPGDEIRRDDRGSSTRDDAPLPRVDHGRRELISTVHSDVSEAPTQKPDGERKGILPRPMRLHPSQPSEINDEDML